MHSTNIYIKKNTTQIPINSSISNPRQDETCSLLTSNRTNWICSKRI